MNSIQGKLSQLPHVPVLCKAKNQLILHTVYTVKVIHDFINAYFYDNIYAYCLADRTRISRHYL